MSNEEVSLDSVHFAKLSLFQHATLLVNLISVLTLSSFVRGFRSFISRAATTLLFQVTRALPLEEDDEEEDEELELAACPARYRSHS